MRMAILLIVLICSSYLNSSASDINFMERKYEGWYWYEDKKKRAKKQVINFPKELTTPTQRKKYVQALFEHALDKAQENPTQKNIIEFIRIQKFVFDRAENFSNAYQEAMQTHPELSGTAKYPMQNITSDVGNRIWRQEQKKVIEKTIQQGAKEYGLFYFYRSTCPFCKRFIPILKHFQKKYGFEVIAVTLDGVKHPDLPDSQINEDLAQKLQVRHVPALYLVNPQTHSIVPMSFGISGLDTLEKNAYRILESQNLKSQNNQEVEYES